MTILSIRSVTPTTTPKPQIKQCNHMQTCVCHTNRAAMKHLTYKHKNQIHIKLMEFTQARCLVVLGLSKGLLNGVSLGGAKKASKLKPLAFKV